MSVIEKPKNEQAQAFRGVATADCDHAMGIRQLAPQPSARSS